MTISIIHNIRQEHGTPAIYETDGKFGLTLFHIVIGLNTFAGKDNIVACFDANPYVLLLEDTKGCTPLGNLWANSRVDIIVHLMQDLCIYRLVIGKRKRDR